LITLASGQHATGRHQSPHRADLNRIAADTGLIQPGTGSDDNRMWSTRKFRIANSSNGRVNAYVRWIGEGPDHEIYILTSRVTGPDPATTTGEVWKIVPP